MAATDRVHSPTPEDLMTYLDGEAPAADRAAIEAHAADCVECRRVMNDLRGVGQVMRSWTLEDAPATLRPARAVTQPTWRLPGFSWRPTFFTMSVGATAATIALFVGAGSLMKPRSTTTGVPAVSVARSSDSVGVLNRAVDGRLDRNGPAERLGASPGGGGGGRPEPQAGPVPAPEPKAVPESAVPRQPSVIRTATLRLVANDFDRARAGVETIVTQAGGFIDQIAVNGAPGAARTLTGSLRLPALRLGDALTRLRQLGQVTEDTQGSEDVTDQLVDLDTRLANSRAEEQRLNDILKNRTGKLSDVLEVEQEIARVRLEIEQMDAQRVNMDRRASYATITLQIDEVRKAGLESGPLSLSTRIRVAAADGLESAFESIVGAVLFVLRAGPAALVWFMLAAAMWLAGRRGVQRAQSKS